MKKSILRASAAWQALALLGAGVATSAIMASPAAAQDYTTGAVVGTVTDGNNRPVAGAQVTLRSQAQNQARTLVTSGSGSFSAAGLVAGTYDVLVHANGFKDYSDTFTVAVAQENRLTVGLASTSTAGTEIVVTGRRVRQDFTKTATGLNLDVEAVTAQSAIPRSITALTLLAPGTARGVSGFGDVASIGGSSVAENAYYINGLNITNPDTYVGSARVPFDFYKIVDVQTGGYAAEFGRATGGVINATTKSGSNTPMLAVHGNFEFPGLRSPNPNTGYALNPTSIGRERRLMNNSITIEAGGALIKDHVFLYGLLQANRVISKTASASANTYEVTKSLDPFYGFKGDIYLTPTQHLEGTFFDTTEHRNITDYNYEANADFTGGTIGARSGVLKQKVGGKNWVVRYTGNITDFFQLSGAYGRNKDANTQTPSDPGAYFVSDRRTATTGGSPTVISTTQPFGNQTINETQRRFYRADADLRFELAGRHHVRFGLDNEDVSEDKILQRNGAAAPVSYSYRNRYVRITTVRLGGHVSGQDRAYYLQDSWEPLRGLTINAGIRDDIFKQANLSNEQYLSLKNNFGLRLAFSYVPNNESPMKFTGSYGRYFIPPAMNLGFRGRDLISAQNFGYGAYTNTTFPIDPVTGLPLAALGPAVSGVAGFFQDCPSDISAAPGHPVNGVGTCNVSGPNIQDPAYAKLAIGTKATYEDEVILGTQYRVNPLITVGLTATYRSLKRISEDTDFAPQLADQFCGIDPSSSDCDYYSNHATYYIWNPGTSSVKLIDWRDRTRTNTLTGLTFPKPKRIYKAVTFDFKRADDGVWNLQGSLTWSKSKGNYEGTVKSDAGDGAQVDAGSTQDFDYRGLNDYNYGLLPNDHRWSFKAFGAVHVTKQLLFGANVQLQSPMHGSCQGYHPTDANADQYGSSSFYCAFGPLNENGNYTETRPSPRGTAWKSQWLKQIDLSARFTIPSIGKGLVLRADVFNVLNTHSILQRSAEHESDFSGGEYTPEPGYLSPVSFQQARYARLGFDMKF